MEGTTDRPYLPDEMYHEVSLHIPGGDYQTVFGTERAAGLPAPGNSRKNWWIILQIWPEAGERKVWSLTCKEKLIRFYEKHGFQCYGESDSSHGGARWYDMRNIF